MDTEIETSSGGEHRPIWPRACLAAVTASSISAAYLSLTGPSFVRRSAWIGMNMGLGTGVYLLFRDRLDQSNAGSEVGKSSFAGAVTGALLGGLRGSPIISAQCAVFMAAVCGGGHLAKNWALDWIRRPSADLNLMETVSHWVPSWSPIRKTDRDQIDLYMETQNTMQTMLENLNEYERSNK